MEENRAAGKGRIKESKKTEKKKRGREREEERESALKGGGEAVGERTPRAKGKP